VLDGDHVALHFLAVNPICDEHLDRVGAPRIDRTIHLNSGVVNPRQRPALRPLRPEAGACSGFPKPDPSGAG
jgi:hypothetical protein